MPSADRPDAFATPEVVVVGAASRDLAPDDPRGWRLGGAVTYSALTTARLGLRTGAVVGADAAAATAEEIDVLRDAGVDVVVVPLGHGPVFENVEHPDGRRQFAHDASDLVPIPALTSAWRSTQAWILAPVAGELSAAWAAVPPEEALVALGWQGLLRSVVAGEPVRRVAPAASPLVDRADLVGVSDDDLAPGTTVAELCRLLRPGATLLVTGGANGGLAVEAGPEGPRRLHRYPALAADRIIDPTGAGDVFLAVVLAARARPQLVGGRIGQRFDLLLGAAAASLLVEAPGLAGVPGRDALRQRMADRAGRRATGRL